MELDGRAAFLVDDRTRGRAGAYCVHLLAGAGAAVERRPGTPSVLPPALDTVLRPARPAPPPSRRRIVVDDTGARPAGHDDDVVVTISPFGLDGPWAGRPASELTLQAWCGSVGGRGEPDAPPVQAGGRLLEWAAGTYAAVGALAALRRPVGEHVDVSVLECGMLVGNVYSYLARSFGDPHIGGSRSVEVPSILPAADGYVGMTTVTAQQFEDFLVMIERPDLLENEGLRSAPSRFARRKEFLAAVHAWSTTRTVDEILELALAFRVPAAPVLAGVDLLGVPHFVERGVFVPGPDGLQVPRRPNSVTPGAPSRVVEPHDDRPLSGLRVLDLTAFLAGPAATHVLAALGADVVKIESPRRPDGMRGATTRRDSPDWLEWGMVFHGVNTGKRSVALDLSDEAERDAFLRLVAEADVVIENFTPRVLDNLGLGYDELRTTNPGITLVRMPAYGLDGPWRDRSGFAQNMEQVSGLAAVTGHPGDHPILPRGPCDPIAGMHAVVALLDALATGRGGLVEVPMVEAILNVAVEGLVEAQTHGVPPARHGNGDPAALVQDVLPAAGDDAWVALTIEDDDRLQAARRVLGDDLAAAIAARPAADVAHALMAAGVPAAPVVLPRDADDHPQLAARGFFEELDHPVVGRHAFPTVPFRFAGRRSPWLQRPAPLVGEHTAEVLSGSVDLP